MRARSATALALLLVVSCSSSPAHRAVGPTTTSRVVAARCATPTRFGADGPPNEVRARATRGEAWGLVVDGYLPPRPGDIVKIVWRVTGHGPLRVRFTAPDGLRRPLAFGPDRHSSSTYHRPGDEWGTGFRFTARGCWHIQLARGTTTGDVWLDV
jgi:hypothetical protein